MNAICSRRAHDRFLEDALADFAKQVWYGDLHLALYQGAGKVGAADEQRRRLLYAVDRLTLPLHAG